MREYRIGRLKGRYVVTWHEAGQRRRYRLDALTLKDAESEALDVIRRETLALPETTIGELWEAYRQHLGKRPTATTMSYTGLPIKAHFGSLRPDQVTTDHSRSYIAARLKAGRKRGAIWTELGHLRACMAWALKMHLIERAPYIELPQKPAPKERYLTRPEIDRLLESSRLSDPHVHLAIILLLATAARVGAILDLTWDRVDMERGQINLRHDMEGPRKGRAVVPMNPMARAALTVSREAALTDHVIEYGGKPIASIRAAFARAVVRAGLKDVSPHVLRHTAGVYMAEAGVPMSRISQLMGHSSTSVTERVYARFAPDHLADAAMVLDFSAPRKVQ